MVPRQLTLLASRHRDKDRCWFLTPSVVRFLRRRAVSYPLLFGTFEKYCAPVAQHRCFNPHFLRLLALLLRAPRPTSMVPLTRLFRSRSATWRLRSAGPHCARSQRLATSEDHAELIRRYLVALSFRRILKSLYVVPALWRGNLVILQKKKNCVV